MSSLVSPGVQVQIIDQSQYATTAAGTVAFVLFASAQDKLTPSNTIAAGTTIANADKVITVTSQRDLTNLFGVPSFQVDGNGNPINGDERNEYGLLAAYSALGVTNTLYLQRANVDLAQLEPSGVRPTGKPNDGTYWLDLSGTNWGIFEWNDEDGFVLTNPTAITSTDFLSAGVPLNTFGSIGDYAVVTTSSSNPIYYKGYDNNWKLVGTDSWKSVVPTITGTTVSPVLTAGSKMIINGNTVTVGNTTVASAVSAINAALITGVTASETSTGQIKLYVDSSTRIFSNAAGNARGTLDTVTSTPDTLQITNAIVLLGGTIDASGNLGLYQAAYATITNSGNTYSYNGPTIQFSDFTDPPAWRASDVTPRPNGSVWFKTSAKGNGASWSIKEYDAITASWRLLAAPLYQSDTSAIQDLDPNAGGAGLAVGTVYVQYDSTPTIAESATFKPYIKNVSGVLTLTGTVAGASGTYNIGDSFTLEVSVPNSNSTQSATVTLTASTSSNMVARILGAGLPNIAAGYTSSGAVYISHLAGGTIKITQLVGTPLDTAGILDDANVQEIISGQVYLGSPFTPLTYYYSTTAPFSNPTNGTLWYYPNQLEVDILINDGAGWKGYRNVSNDARGYDLTNTDETGVILSASTPTTQLSGGQLVPGDLWINTSASSLENFPVLSRYTGSGWVLIDNTDNVDANGIVFADARWSADGNVNVITGDIPAIEGLLTSDHIDPDCPAYQLYARGTLLFNTRRSGYNVKRFEKDYFIAAELSGGATETSTWVSHSGENPTTGVPYFGHKAQRNTIVKSLKAAIASNTVLREENTQFNLICCPGYPELIGDMITLNNDRQNTAFIIGDSPLQLSSDSTTLTNWAKNTALAIDNGEEGLVSNSEYLAVYYPSGVATNLDGNTVVVPPSHMILRTFIRSDAVSYPWFAPAGVRRGLVDNATAIGYVDVNDENLFQSIGVTAGLRDVLYTNRVNPLTVLPGIGLTVYGQKTRASQASAMDRVNVARLVVYLRTQLAKLAAPFIFEPNDTITRSQVTAVFNSLFHDLVAKRAIYDFLVVCDTTNNTPIRIDNNELWVDIAIQPVKAIEFIYVPVRLQNTGAALTIQ